MFSKRCAIALESIAESLIKREKLQTLAQEQQKRILEQTQKNQNPDELFEKVLSLLAGKFKFPDINQDKKGEDNG
jgi:hypothetical protein